MREIPKDYEIYQHFKGEYYQVRAVAEHEETGELFVVYTALYGDNKTYTRTLSNFMSEVDRNKYPDEKHRYRFTKVDFQGTREEKQPVRARNESKQEQTESSTSNDESENQKFVNAKLSEELRSNVKEEDIDAGLMRFLDAGTYEEKLEILVMLRNKVDEHMLNTMAASMDVELKEGTLEERYDDIKYCLSTLEKYECNRLR
ncbi:MAG: DUF1653 domain-containing protein [Clostridia bacterium]|nr:DUF1653 domain-containing protein [Clostridia bacterium]